MVKFVWCGLICCGTANGLVYSYVESPEKYFYILGILMVCSILLMIHHRSTEKWCERKKDDNMDYDEENPRVFINSVLLAFVLLLIACIMGYVSCIIGLTTVLIAFIIAADREVNYS